MKTAGQHTAFITVANARRIAYLHTPLVADSVNKKFYSSLYKRPLFVFSKGELSSIARIQSFIRDADNFMASHKRRETIGHSQLVFPVHPPAYHSDFHCNHLYSDYYNFYVPEIILEKGAAAIVRFREWCILNRPLFERNRSAFEMKVRLIFGVSLSEIYRENSGVQIISQLDVQNIEESIDNLLDNALAYYEREKAYRPIIDEYGQKTHILRKSDLSDVNTLNFDEWKFKEVLMYYNATFKKPLVNLLVEYYKAKYNTDFKFNLFLLEKLGFSRCKACST